MRIHSNVLTPGDLFRAMSAALPEAPDVNLILQGTFGSRSHAKAFEIALRGHGARHTRRPNTGIAGSASAERAATFDDWGWFCVAVFDMDPDAKVGQYNGSEDFHRATKDAYVL